MKAPRFRGHKKGYSELWLGEVKSRRYDGDSRLRIRYPNGRWRWGWTQQYRLNDCKPCWLRDVWSPGDAIKRMKNYDKNNLRKTIFLGYVKGI